MNNKKHFGLFLLDTLITVTAFVIVSWILPGTMHRIFPTYHTHAIWFLVIWVVVSLTTGKFKLAERNKLALIIRGLAWSCFVTIFLTFFLLISLKILVSRKLIFGTISLAYVMENLFFLLLIYRRRFRAEVEGVTGSGLVSTTPLLTDDLPTDNFDPHLSDGVYKPSFAVPHPENTLRPERLKKFFHQDKNLQDFLAETIDFSSIAMSATYVLKSQTYFNIEHLEPGTLQLFVNLHPVNDLRRINLYFIKTNQNLTPGGVFVGCAEVVEQRFKKFTRNFGRFWGRLFYVGDFIFYRIFPKLSFTQGLYFKLTGGRNRALSLTEVLGRLHYCGFGVLAYKEFDGKMYFIVNKLREPSADISPSYGPFIKLKRTGKNGRVIYVYKFRTMHPYSEYLHDYMTKRYGFGEKGKVDGDFRVTAWGRVLRKFWLDEIPQLYNWAKGDLALVGVRPLSARFLKEYPADLYEERLKYKPGCLPPYVAYRKQKVDEYIEAERIYFAEKARHPLFTDIKVFFLVIYNILTGKITSE